MFAYKNGQTVRLISRRGIEHTARFPDIAAAVAKLPSRSLILDSEVCVFDAQFVSQFHLLGDGASEELATPPVFIAFDLLRADARDLHAKPLADRRPVLEDAIAGSRFVLPAFRLEPDCFAAWNQVKRGGWEGLVAKDNASRYVGGPTRRWHKTKSATGSSSSLSGWIYGYWIMLPVPVTRRTRGPQTSLRRPL